MIRDKRKSKMKMTCHIHLHFLAHLSHNIALRALQVSGTVPDTGEPFETDMR